MSSSLIFPTLKGRMGTWDYFLVRMEIGDLVKQIDFAGEIHDDKTLDDQLQRSIDQSRSKKDIAKYLSSRDDRFFNSIVVAALGGKPKFHGLRFESNSDDGLQAFLEDDNIQDHFGVVKFNNDLKVYALDGQHRLSAIKSILKGDENYKAPKGFEKETISVIFLIPPDEDDYDWKVGYRSVFTALNRYAKPTEKNTNIIMDQVDRFALVTRRLIHEYELFLWRNDGGSPRIDTSKKSEAMNANDPFFMTIVGLYEINKRLLWNEEFVDTIGANPSGNKFKELLQEIPEDEEVEKLYNSLENIWEGISLVLPELFTGEPQSMRRSQSTFEDDDIDHLLLRPIGQKGILGPIIRQLLDENGIVWADDAKKVAKAIEPLKLINWDQHHPLWEGFSLEGIEKKDEDGNPYLFWRMRNQQRSEVMEHAKDIIAWVVGLIDLDKDEIEEMKDQWAAFLIPAVDNDKEEEVFKDLIKLRTLIVNKN